MNVITHLKNEAARQRQLYANPVVAIDSIAGLKRAEHCERWAQAVANVDDTQALEMLIADRNGQVMDTTSSTSLVFSISQKQWFEGVIDAISRENRGWIEVGSHGFDGKSNLFLHLPRYRRMLDTNHSVACLSRERDEDDAAWLLRRSEWLARYHPEVPVRHATTWWLKNKSVPIELGTVATFAAKDHTVEADLIGLRGIRTAAGQEFKFVDVFMAPKTLALATVVQTKGEPVPLGLRNMGRYHVEVIADSDALPPELPLGPGNTGRIRQVDTVA